MQQGAFAMLTLLNLLSAVTLLVWGTHIVRTGILRVFGSNLRRIISQNMDKRPLAFIAGILEIGRAHV